MATAKPSKKNTTAAMTDTGKSPQKSAGKTAGKQAAPKKASPVKAASSKMAVAKAPARKPAVKKTAEKKPAGKTAATKKSAPVKAAPAKAAPTKATPAKAAPAKTAASNEVPENTVPRKTTAIRASKDANAYRLEHLDKDTLVSIIAKLEEMRLESLNIVNNHMQADMRPREESLDVGDDLDQASNERFREFNLIMHQRHLRRLQQIEEAYGRMEDGYYGLCEGTDEPINPRRLLIMPLARYSIEFQEMQEKTMGRSALDGGYADMDESFGAEE